MAASRLLTICRSIHVLAPADCVWRHVTDVDLATFPHPVYLSVLGIPKPLRSEILEARVGGVRIAYFNTGKRFMQEITDWEPGAHYAFTFRADPGFRVGHVLDLAAGPFRMVAGAYTISPLDRGVRLLLSSRYELRGVGGLCVALPVRLSLDLFQRSLLRGIKANAEREHAQGNTPH